MIDSSASVPVGYAGQFFNAYSDGTSVIFAQTSESYMEIPYYSALNPPVFSMAVWVLTSQDPNSGLNTPRTILTSRYYSIFNGTGQARGYSIALNAANLYIGTVGSSTQSPGLWYNIIGPAPCTDDGCYDHLVLQCDSVHCEFWVNYVLYTVSDSLFGVRPAYQPQTQNPLRVGANTGTAQGCLIGGVTLPYCNGFTGVIKNIRFKDTTFLAQADIFAAIAKGPDATPALSTGAVVGVFFAVTFAILFLGGCGALFLKRWRKQQMDGHSQLQEET